ncbi:MAG: Fpg/Nei family DNA glycosylase [Candidatus Bipolaricaulota bacterium]|nr:MAG: Fpg/Nei family DNA glycosylase [Candidatus Bipolaricaulota bacterium]
MPELPEMASRAREMHDALSGRTIDGAEVLQPKCLNVEPEELVASLSGARVAGVSHRGKWLQCDTSRGHLLINLGMGGEILLVARDALPEKWRVRFDLDRGGALAINFWWLGHVHYVPEGELATHRLTCELGPNATELSQAAFTELLAGRRGRIKPFLLDQRRVAGIGNAYIHDILFRAKLHPLRTIPTLSRDEIRALHRAIRAELGRSLKVGGAWYELDLHGNPGGFRREDLLIAYREGEPCPECRTPIERVRTGANHGFLCPSCQPLVPTSVG